ncbi:hypothetical protein HYD47_00910 [Mycoplasmopsis bovis]|nr:hypothetical protein HYD47_00910 [Mycoplasmopsis bovis]
MEFEVPLHFLQVLHHIRKVFDISQGQQFLRNQLSKTIGIFMNFIKEVLTRIIEANKISC